MSHGITCSHVRHFFTAGAVGFCDGRHKMCVYADLTDVLLNSTDRLPD